MDITKHFWPYVSKAKMRLRGAPLKKNFGLAVVFSIFENLFTFFSCLFTILKKKKNYRLSNTFWLNQHGVLNAFFQSYSHLKSETLIWVTLYLQDDYKNPDDFLVLKLLDECVYPDSV